MDIEDVKRLDVQAGDVLLVTVPAHTTAELFARIAAAVRANFPPEVKILMLTGDVTVGVVRPVVGTLGEAVRMATANPGHVVTVDG